MAALSASVAAGEVTPGEAAEFSKLVEAYVRALIYQRDGIVRGPHGEQMTREEVESPCRAAGKFAHFCGETAMRL